MMRCYQNQPFGQFNDILSDWRKLQIVKVSDSCWNIPQSGSYGAPLLVNVHAYTTYTFNPKRNIQFVVFFEFFFLLVCENTVNQLLSRVRAKLFVFGRGYYAVDP